MTSNQRPRWNILLPIKVLTKGKSRFKTLSDEDKIELIKAMANDVIDELILVPAIELITIIGIDHRRLGERTQAKIQSIVPDPALGINIDILSLHRVSEHTAVLLPDLPSLKADEVALALTLAGNHDQSFISDRSGLGTTMYLSTKKESFHPRFGAQSAREYAENSAVELTSSEFIGIKHDCDNLSDLLNLSLPTLGPATRAFVQHWDFPQ